MNPEIDTLLQQATQLLDLQRPEHAANLLHRVLAQDPRNAHALRLLGLCLLNQEDYPEAAVVLRQAVALDPLHPHGYACLAEAETELAHWDAARAAVAEALRLNPAQARFHGLQAQLALRQLAFGEALRAARNGLAFDPTDVLCHTVQGRALAAMGHAGAGAALLTDALAHSPENAALHTTLGFNHLDAGTYRRAREHFAIALRQRPSDKAARQGLLQAFKHKFWLYRVLSRGGQGVGRTVLKSGFWQLGLQTRAILVRLLVPALAIGLWIVGRASGFFGPDASLRDAWNFLLLVLVALALLIATLRFSFISLVRFDADARHLLSAREAANVNLFWLFLATALVVGAAWLVPNTPTGVAGPLGLAVLVPVVANRLLPKRPGWRWSWTWAGLLLFLSYWVMGLTHSDPGTVGLGLGFVGATLLLYAVVFEFYQPSK